MRKIRKNDTVMVKPTVGKIIPARVTSVTNQTSLTVSFKKGNTAAVTVAANSAKTSKSRLISQ